MYSMAAAAADASEPMSRKERIAGWMAAREEQGRKLNLSNRATDLEADEPVTAEQLGVRSDEDARAVEESRVGVGSTEREEAVERTEAEADGTTAGGNYHNHRHQSGDVALQPLRNEDGTLHSQDEVEDRSAKLGSSVPAQHGSHGVLGDHAPASRQLHEELQRYFEAAELYAPTLHRSVASQAQSR